MQGKRAPLMLLLCLLTAMGTSRAAITRLASEDKQHLLYDTFQSIRTVREIPPEMQAQYAQLSKTSISELSDPDGPFQATDVVNGKPLPTRRLILAGVSRNYGFVYYERGGIAYGTYLLLFRLEKGKARLIWGATGIGRVSDIAALRKGILKNQMDDRSDYAW